MAYAGRLAWQVSLHNLSLRCTSRNRWKQVELGCGCDNHYTQKWILQEIRHTMSAYLTVLRWILARHLSATIPSNAQLQASQFKSQWSGTSLALSALNPTCIHTSGSTPSSVSFLLMWLPTPTHYVTKWQTFPGSVDITNMLFFLVTYAKKKIC